MKLRKYKLRELQNSPNAAKSMKPGECIGGQVSE
jgi:hypothetical protein